MAKRNKRKSNSVSVDFTGVESNGRAKPGRGLATVKACTLEESSNGSYLSWQITPNDGGLVYHNTSLQPQSLWALRNFLEAMGLEVPEAEMELDLDEYIGLELGVEIEMESYQGKKRPRIIDVFPASELDGEADGNDGDEDDDDEDDDSKVELTASDVKKMNMAELEDVVESNDLEPPKKVSRDKNKLADWIIDQLELEEADDDEDEGENEEADSRIKKGSIVKFEDDGEKMKGKVSSIEDGVAVVVVDDEEWEIELSDLTFVK